MTEQPTIEPQRERHVHEPGLPSWVPTTIGVVLVVMAALAVWTGLRFRNPTLANGIIHPRRAPKGMTGGGPPGEPEPGASLVFPENAPTAAAGTVTGAGVITARRALVTNVFPDDAMVYVNGVLIGQAKQFRGNDGYDFPAAGAYTIRLTAPGYKDAQFVVNASEDAQQEVARLDVRLQRQ